MLRTISAIGSEVVQRPCELCDDIGSSSVLVL